MSHKRVFFKTSRPFVLNASRTKEQKSLLLKSEPLGTMFYGKFSFVLFTVSIFLLCYQNMAQVGLSFIDISHKPKIREVDYRLQKLRPFHLQNQNWDHRFYCIIRFFFSFFFSSKVPDNYKAVWTKRRLLRSVVDALVSQWP